MKRGTGRVLTYIADCREENISRANKHSGERCMRLCNRYGLCGIRGMACIKIFRGRGLLRRVNYDLIIANRVELLDIFDRTDPEILCIDTPAVAGSAIQFCYLVA